MKQDRCAFILCQSIHLAMFLAQ